MPIVAVRKQDRSAWWFAGGAVIAAVLLFTALEARRSGVEQADASRTEPSAFAAPEAIPDLVVPAVPVDRTAALATPWAQPGDARRPGLVSPPMAQTRIPAGSANVASPAYSGENPYLHPPPAPPLLVSGEGSTAVGPPQSAEATSAGSSTGSAKGARIMAGRLENPSTTVIQGTLINAVLETALDSSSPGQTRAVVTRDIHGFDGTRVLIPRGTRLYGEYEAEVTQGQNRAQIRWSRLLRPDGVSVALDSPAADPLGRAGVRARVNNHFMQRLGNALLGTASAVGSTLVTRNIGNSPVIVAVPGSAQTATQSLVPNSTEIKPTLSVRQGTRITVFVEHDLDFSSVDQAP
ncbi:MAG: conjugal transfer protein TrbI [Pseudomonadota bacterium]|nr:conjugal transfer protein TrbI [Pseudomonadota bacterium]